METIDILISISLIVWCAFVRMGLVEPIKRPDFFYPMKLQKVDGVFFTPSYQQFAILSTTNQSSIAYSRGKQFFKNYKRDSCIFCDLPVRPHQEALLCDVCDRWQHRTCQTAISHEAVQSEQTVD